MGRIGETALILRIELPAELEELRLRSASGASEGLPAHVTLLYPFVAPESLDNSVRVRLTEIATSHLPFAYRLTGPHRWPDILYASVEPQTPFVALQADLARGFPEHPLYGGAYDFSPHVTIAEGAAAESATSVGHRAWDDLSEAATARAEAIEVIFRTTGNWSTMWRIPLAE
jgi:2'-5' RNA ligase